MSVLNLVQTSTLFYIFVILQMSKGVKINKLQVPAVIQHGAPAVLDCDFTLETNDQYLVVKWYFHKNKTLVYQWIPDSRKRPQGLGILKGRLNLEHVASEDANSVHRALHILKAGFDLSGDYTCSVSTLQSEDIRTKSMLVFVPAKRLDLRRVSADEGVLRVQCSADGIFPKPVMTLHSQEREITETEVLVNENKQLYEISASASLPALKGPEEFACELRIPQANYSVRRETVFYPDSEASTLSNTRWLITTCLLTIWSGIIGSLIGLC